MSQSKKLSLPLSKEDVESLECGDSVLLSGVMYTLRDAGHKRVMDYISRHGCLPYDLEGQTIFYAGPTPATPTQPFGAIGPTTATRMDFATPKMMDLGIIATIGKGKRSKAVIEACKKDKGVYFAAVGGIAALLAERVKSSELVAWEDLGTEALRRIVVEDFPVYVAIDVAGNTLYK